MKNYIYLFGTLSLLVIMVLMPAQYVSATASVDDPCQGSVITSGTSGCSRTSTAGVSGSSQSDIAKQIQDLQNKLNAMTQSMINNYAQQYSPSFGATVAGGAGVVNMATDVGSGAGAGASCPQITTNLGVGESGTMVQLLTTQLVAEGLMTTPQSTFDQTVFSAVVAYQNKYKAQILTPLGITAGTGFVGASTRAYMNDHIAGCGSSNASLPVTVSPENMITMRYLKINTTDSRSWVTWNEIQIYDQNGVKITPTNVTVSADWGGSWPKPADYTGYMAAFDGDPNTGWVAGESARNCNWGGDRGGCAQGYQSGWIQVDLGKDVVVSKIKLLVTNNPVVSTATHEVWIGTSADGGAIRKYQSWTRDFVNGTWLEFPTSPTAPAPTAYLSMLTATGESTTSATYAEGEMFKFNWTTTGADYIDSTVTTADDNLPLTCANNPKLEYGYTIGANGANANELFDAYFPMKSGWSIVNIGPGHNLGIQPSGQSVWTFDACQVPKNIKITLYAYQTGTNRVASSSVIVKMKRFAVDNLLTSGQFFDMGITAGGYKYFEMSRGGTMNLNFYRVAHDTGVWKATPPAGISVTFGSPVNTGLRSNPTENQSFPTIVRASGSIQPGLYIVPVTYTIGMISRHSDFVVKIK